MIYYLVVWIGLSCPGGALKGLIPPNLRPLACASIPMTQLYASETEAISKLKELGASANLKICHDLKGILTCEPAKVTWEPLIN